MFQKNLKRISFNTPCLFTSSLSTSVSVSGHGSSQTGCHLLLPCRLAASSTHKLDHFPRFTDISTCYLIQTDNVHLSGCFFWKNTICFRKLRYLTSSGFKHKMLSKKSMSRPLYSLYVFNVPYKHQPQSGFIRWWVPYI